MEKNRKIKKMISKHRITIWVVILLFVAKFLGFIKNVILAKYYGTGDISDSYQMAISIPMVTVGILLLSYQAFTKGFFISQKNNDENEYVSSFVNFVFAISISIVAVVVIFRGSLAHVFAPGFDSIRLQYVNEFLIPISIGVVMQVIANVMSEFLRAKKSFIAPQAAYLLINIIEIGTIFLAFFANIQWLAYGYLLANATYLFILLIMCYRRGYRYRLVVKKKHIKLFGKIFVPVLLSSLVVEVNVMVDKIFASNFEIGTVSTINYAVNIRSVLLIIASGGLTVLFPKISKKSVEKNTESFNKNIKQTAKIMTVLYLPITIFVIIFAKEIVGMIYFRGEFGVESLVGTVNCFIMYAIGMLGICIRDLLVKALYCLEKGREIIFVSAGSVGLNILLNALLSRSMGYIGLPLATSITATLSIIPLYYYYKKSISLVKTVDSAPSSE